MSLGYDEEHNYTGYAYLNELSVRKIVYCMNNKNNWWNKEKHRGYIVSMFIDKFKRGKRAFDGVVKKEKDDTERNKRPFLCCQDGCNYNEHYAQNSGKCCQRVKQ